MKKIATFQNSPLWFWVILPSILFVLAWEPIGLTPLLLISFVPFFVIHERLRTSSVWKYFGLLYVSLLGWNITTTWWVYFASASGAVTMLLLNSLFMCVPFLIWRSIQKDTSYSLWLFILFTFLWVLYEYGHHRWDLSWPWLALGNGFSATPQWVQWYEFTGTLGGTVWVLWSNIFVFWYGLNRRKNTLFVWSFWIGVFSILSVVLYSLVDINNGNPQKIALLQPSFNPWNEKFERDPIDMQREMEELSQREIDTHTDWLLWPETCLVRSIDVDQINEDRQISMLQSDLLKPFPKLQLLSGFHGIKYYQTSQKPTRSARVSQYDSRIFYDVFNSALWLQKDSGAQYYHKSKLVPGTEQMPFIHTIPFLESLAITLDENSITGSLGVSDNAYALGVGEKVAPIICYESIYGDYIRGYIKEGATWLGIITNDAWWENTPGHKQHFSYARLRAIEFRKWIGRSANTGITGFIDPLGNTYAKTQWYEKTCVSKTIYANSQKTFYYYIGDMGFLSIYALVSLLFLVVRNYVKGLPKKKENG